MPKKKSITATKLVKMMSRNRIGVIPATARVPNKRKQLLEEARLRDEE